MQEVVFGAWRGDEILHLYRFVAVGSPAGLRGPSLGDGYASAVTNFGFMAKAVWTTEEAVEAIKQAD